MAARAHVSPSRAVNASASVRAAKRSEPSLGRSWTEGSCLFDFDEEDSQAVAILAPANGHAPLWSGPRVPGALVRGSKTELPSLPRPERSLWPHDSANPRMAEVSLCLPGATPLRPTKLRSPLHFQKDAQGRGSPPETRALAAAPREELPLSPASRSSPLDSEVMSKFSRIERFSASSRRKRPLAKGCPLGLGDCAYEASTYSGASVDFLRSPMSSLELASNCDDSLELDSLYREAMSGAFDAEQEAARTSSGRSLQKSFSESFLSGPAVTADGRGRSEAELMMIDSLRPRVDALLWNKSMVCKPPVADPLKPKLASKRPEHTAAFQRARERAFISRVPEMRSREKSGKLLVAHYEIRRAGMPPEEKPEKDEKEPHPGCHACVSGLERRPTVPPKVDPKEASDDSSMMMRVILGVDDTPESLADGINLLKNASSMVGVFGGARHPTSIISVRTLCVIERKLEVLSPLAEAVGVLEELVSNKDKVLVDVIKSTAEPKEIAGLAWHMKQRVTAATHDGSLEEAYRQDFQTFVSAYKLPSDHSFVKRAWELVHDEAADWAEKCYENAQKEVDQELTSANQEALANTHVSQAGNACKSLVTFVEGLGVDIYRREVEQTDILARQARATAVLRYAEAEAYKDKHNEGSKEVGETAAKQAAKIEYAIKAAIQWGVEGKHPQLLQALEFAHHLRAQRVFRFSSDAMTKIKPGVLGSAGKVADEIDEAIKEAIVVYGVPQEHKVMQEVRTLSLEARSDESRLQRKQEAVARMGKKTSG